MVSEICSANSTNILDFGVRVLDSAEAPAGGWLPIGAYPHGLL